VGFVWAPGYWDWDGGHHRHTWRKGHYMRERRGEHWVPNQWVERSGRYHYEPGRWER
ncbi:MAG: YXWGXW repeat-containing protein, partial [Casimicrobiaceae bacterium]